MLYWFVAQWNVLGEGRHSWLGFSPRFRGQTSILNFIQINLGLPHHVVASVTLSGRDCFYERCFQRMRGLGMIKRRTGTPPSGFIGTATHPLPVPTIGL